MHPPDSYKVVIMLFGEDSLDTEASIAYFSNNLQYLLKNDFKKDNIAICLKTISSQESIYKDIYEFK